MAGPIVKKISREVLREQCAEILRCLIPGVLLLLVLFAASFAASSMAAGTVYVRTVDNMMRQSTCTIPVTREDGSPLPLNEIAYFELRVSQDPLGLISSALMFTDNNLACDGFIDMSVLSDGQWYLFWQTYDTNGVASRNSTTVPFALASNTGSPPAPPSGVVLH